MLLTVELTDPIYLGSQDNHDFDKIVFRANQNINEMMAVEVEVEVESQVSNTK